MEGIDYEVIRRLDNHFPSLVHKAIFLVLYEWYKYSVVRLEVVVLYWNYDADVVHAH